MSRLDRHVAAVQRKLTLALFLQSLAWTAVALAAVALGTVLVAKLLGRDLPLKAWGIGAAAAVVIAAGFTLFRHPSRRQAAIAIDRSLSLHEKFSTALYIRSSSDPFAQAAVRDAEHTAEKVDLAGRFAVEFPRPAYSAIALAVAVALACMLPKAQWLSAAVPEKKANEQLAKVEQARKDVKEALIKIDAIAKAGASANEVDPFRKPLLDLEKQPIKDPEKAQRTAAKALQDLNDSLKREVAMAKATNSARQKLFREAAEPSPDDKGPMADARRAIAREDFQGALEKVAAAVDNFDRMSDEEQQKAAEQMAAMASKLTELANDPNVQKNIQSQLQQAGANAAQAKQISDLMKKAAAGNPQAQQQIQNMAAQVAQQMNNGQGATPQQMQALQNALAQAQGQANAQSQAGQLGQAAQQMAGAMAQASQGKANANGQGGQAAAGGMAGAQQAMKDALNQMQGVQQDANQIAAAQQMAQDAAAQACANCNGQGNKPGAGGIGKWAAGNPQPAAGGQGGPGIGGAGARIGKAVAPYKTERTDANVVSDPQGKIISNTLVQDSQPQKGEMANSNRTVTEADLRDQTDEVDDTRADRASQEAVKRYFRTMADDAPANPK